LPSFTTPAAPIRWPISLTNNTIAWPPWPSWSSGSRCCFHRLGHPHCP
jgi:hypothetical protein